MRAAAEASAVSQPALTQMIKSVEVGLGVELFLRSPRGLEPTQYVPPLIRYLQEIRREIEEAKQELRQFRVIRSNLPL